MFNLDLHYKIVIIDSGVNNSHPIIAGSAPVDACEAVFNADNSVVTLVPEQKDTYGHGTAIAAIIRKQFKEESVLMIKLIDDDDGCDETKLLTLLKFIYENVSCDIINMSLGMSVCENYSDMYDICKKISDKGVIIVSAFSKTGAVSYPAAFDCVIGVIHSDKCNKNTDFEWYSDSRINIRGMGRLQRVAWVNPDYMMQMGSSFACGYVTAQVVRFFNSGIKTKNDILNEFKKIAVDIYEFSKVGENRYNLFEIKKAAVFPFNKENHSLIRYADLLDFEIVDVYDTKFSMTVGNTTTRVLKDEKVKNLTIKNIEKIDWDSFDTLIMGHMFALEKVIRHPGFQKELLDTALAKGKKVYAYDDLYRSLGYKLSDKLYFPIVTPNSIPYIPFEQLFKISKPVLGVFGTSSQQGKFTLQVRLREKFIKDGYKLGQIGTEPSALLYGMDYVYPMGYRSSVYVKEHDAVKHLNYITNALCEKGCDIIMVGSQSGSLSYDYTSLKILAIPTLNLLMGTVPDAIVLCVNPYDELEYVERTIAFLESFIHTKIVALVMFPMDLRENWNGTFQSKEPLREEKYVELKRLLENKFNRPVFKLGDEADETALYEKIIDFFTAE